MQMKSYKYNLYNKGGEPTETITGHMICALLLACRKIN